MWSTANWLVYLGRDSLDLDLRDNPCASARLNLCPALLLDMRKTSIYLSDEQGDHLARLA
jgi:hypothetical protein